MIFGLDLQIISSLSTMLYGSTARRVITTCNFVFSSIFFHVALKTAKLDSKQMKIKAEKEYN
jgi:hypothetical protein